MKSIKNIIPVLAILTFAVLCFGCKKSADATEDFPKQTKVDPNQTRYKALFEDASKDSIDYTKDPNFQPGTQHNGADSLVIMVDKATMKLRVIDPAGKVVVEYPIACGKNYGQKKRTGDEKTPEGTFRICSIEKAESWAYDFKDGKGPITGAYGPWFFRLVTPGFSGVGIHGTHDPSTIGTRDTHGCIRLKNSDLVDLKKYVYVGMPVTITPSQADINADDGVKQ